MLKGKNPFRDITHQFVQGFDNSDESETSSLCSEKSFDYSRGRPSDVSNLSMDFSSHIVNLHLRNIAIQSLLK